MTIPLFLDNRSFGTNYIDDIIESKKGRRYEIQDRINCGGNAVIHLCVDNISGEEYAVKFLLATSLRRIKRFKQEINLLKQISHEQLIGYIDDGNVQTKNKKRRSRRIPFLIMPVADNNLMEYFKFTQRHIPFEEYISQFKGLTSALAALHQKAIHRDIKPENILIKGETWLLSDLGLCKYLGKDQKDITLEREPIGPRYWMSPEETNRMMGNKDEVSQKSDLYQLCSIFWFIVTGRHPTGVICKEDWTGPDALFEPIYKMLSHSPESRPYNANELFEALDIATI